MTRCLCVTICHVLYHVQQDKKLYQDVDIDGYCYLWDVRATATLTFRDNGLGRKHQFYPGISVPTGIMSTLFTSALVHYEDAELASVNYHFDGHPKVFLINL